MTARQTITAVLLFSTLVLNGCRKIDLTPKKKKNPSRQEQIYLIPKGKHSCAQNKFVSVQYAEQIFEVSFDSSAIYRTLVAANQYDVNKLFGFSDNDGEHHTYSARFGWRWNDNALRLFAYVYNRGIITSKEMMMIEIGTTYRCSITVAAGKYKFTVNNVSVSMPRSSATSLGSGYKLYPYFGGSETAPHDIRIRIKEL